MPSWVKRFPLIWVIPAAGLALAGYLAVTFLADRGPEVTVTFAAADGISAGTKVSHKSVDLGTVTRLTLAADLSHVDASVRMTRDAKPYLTNKARFWVVRPQISGGTVSGLSTILSGSFIEMDPGGEGGTAQRAFKALDAPPGFRSDEPGTTFKLRGTTIASLTSGTPVFYRDVLVGEALGYAISEGTPEIIGEVFVRAPFDKRVRSGSVWWQASGVETVWEQLGLRVEVPSVQAALSGGLAFNVPPGSPDYPPAAAETVFPLFLDQPAAERASNRARLTYSVDFKSSAPGLAPGSPVLLFGRQVGDVTKVQLEGQFGSADAVVRTTISVLPGSLAMIGDGPPVDDADLAPRLVAGGMRAALVTTSYVTGSQAVSLEFDARPTTAPAVANGVIVLPAVNDNGVAGMLASVSGFLASVKAMPLQSWGNALNNGLLGLISTLSGLNAGKQAHLLTAMLQNARAAIRETDANLAPLLNSLPATVDGLRKKLSQANQALASADRSFGTGSSPQAGLARQLASYYDTARYVRLLSDYLSRHPEAIVRGTSSQGAER